MGKMLFCDLKKDDFKSFEVSVSGKKYKIERDHKLHHGSGELVNLKWYQYNIQSEEPLPFGYNSILVTPYMVTESLRQPDQLAIIINGAGVTKSCAPLPNMDGKTGNVHDRSFKLEQLDGVKICQLVACRQGFSGPSIQNSILNRSKNYYYYIPNKRVSSKSNKCEDINSSNEKGFYVPKAAYYPLYDQKGNVIDDKNAFQGSEANILLNSILKAIWEHFESV